MWLVGVSDSVTDLNNFMRYLVAGFKSRLNPYLLQRVFYRLGLYPFNDTYTHYNTKIKVKEDK